MNPVASGAWSAGHQPATSVGSAPVGPSFPAPLRCRGHASKARARGSADIGARLDTDTMEPGDAAKAVDALVMATKRTP